MIYKVVIEPRAVIDIKDAIDFYESREIGLGNYFYETVSEHIDKLEKHPFFQIRYKDYHGFPIQKSPFILLYYFDEETKTIYIMSVFNTSLNPKKHPK